MVFYFYKIIVWDEVKQSEIEHTGLVIGEDYGSAANRLVSNFHNVSSISLEETVHDEVMPISKEVMALIKKENL